MQKGLKHFFLVGVWCSLILACGGPTKEPAGCPPNCSDVPLCPSGGCVDSTVGDTQAPALDLTGEDPGAQEVFSDPATVQDEESVSDPGNDPGSELDPGQSDDGVDIPVAEDVPVVVDIAADTGASEDPGSTEPDLPLPEDEGVAPEDIVEPVDEGESSDQAEDINTEPDVAVEVNCETSADCPGFQSCSVASVCISAEICLSHEDCVEGNCHEAECTNGTPSCEDGETCDSGGHCDPVLHVCLDQLPCASNQDCLTQFCNTDLGSCFQCVGASDCPEGQPLCDSGQCIHLGACLSDANCPAGEVCQGSGLCGVPLPLDDVFDTTGGNNSEKDAVTLNAGSYPNLTIHPSDPDYYKIDIPAGKSLRVAARGSNPDAVLEGRLIDLDTGFVLGERENLSYFTVLYAPSQNLTRHVLLELKNLSGSLGIYELEVRLDSQSPCVDDSYDLTGSNDILGKAELLYDPHTTLVDRSICPDDKDWYQIDLATDEELIVWFWREQGSPEPNVILRDNMGIPINTGESIGDHITMREDILPAGTYYLSIVPEEDEDMLKYRLQVDRWSKQLCSTDTHEVDDIPWLGLQKPLTGAALTLCANDVDYFPAHTESNEGLEVTVSYNNSFAQIHVEVTDLATNEIVAEINNPLGPVGPQVLSVEVAAETQPRDFLIKTERTLTNFAGGTGYTLSATPVAELCVDDAYEPNNDQASAALLSTSGPIAQFVFGEMCSTDEADWYRINLSPGEHLAMDVLAEPAALDDLDFKVWKDVAGSLVSAPDLTPSSMGLGLNTSIQLDAAESVDGVYLEVQSSQTQSYTIFPIVVGSMCSDDPEEPDNTPLSGRELSLGTSLTGNLCMGNPDLIYFTWDNALPTNPVITGSTPGNASIIKIYMNIRDANLQPVSSPKLQAPGPEASTILDLASLELENGVYFIELTSLFPVGYTLDW